ncbi:MAG: PAS domain S-box protein [Pyrinomonadaceae bacterium]
MSFVGATLLRMSLKPILGSDFPYIIYLIAIIFTAWYGGLWPALLATALGMFGAVYFFIPPQYTLHLKGPANLIGLFLFAVTGLTSGFLSEAMHKSRLRVVNATDALDKAQERFRGIYESSLDAIVYANLDGEFVDFNRAFERLTGYTRAELLSGVHYNDLTPQEYQEIGNRCVERMFETDEPQEYEKEYFRKDGTRVPVSLSIFIVRESSNKPAGMAAIIKDISERKKIETEVKEQAEIVETVNHLGQMVAAELDQQKLVQAVTDAATELTGAHFGAFFYNVLDERGASYMLYTLSGVPREAFTHFPMPRATDLFGPTFRGEGTIRIDDVKQDSRYGKNSPYYGMPPGHLPVTSYLAVPVISRSGEVLGGLFFGHPDAAVFSERDERIVEGLAAQAAVAMDNARLFEAAQRARERAEASEKRSAFLAEASEVLASSLDYETTLASVARLAVPHIADWCAVHMLDNDKEIRQLAVAHVDPSKVEMANELRRRFPTRRDDPVGVAKVMRTGQAEIYAEITDELIKATAQSDEHARISIELGLKSAMIVPMVVHGQVLGAITLI